jgi:hypothetical protein
VWGIEDQFAPAGLNARCRLGQATFVGTEGKGREAPIPAVRGIEIDWQ